VLHTPVMKHEGFLVPEPVFPRKRVIRQDRVALIPKKFTLLCGQHRVTILNVSSFGLTVNSTEKDTALIQAYFPGAEAKPVVILFNEIEVQRLRLRLTRVELPEQSVFNDRVFGFESVGESIAVNRINAMELADETISASRAGAVRIAPIPSKFKSMVFEMREFLGQLQRRIDAIEQRAPRDNAVDNLDFRQTIARSVAAYLGNVIPSWYQSIPEVLAGADEPLVALCSEFIRQQLGPLVYGAPFAFRAYNKPRGYAGDYEMMNHLYRDEMVGGSLFDQCMHKYFIDEPAGQAVKNRGFFLLEKIRQAVARSGGQTVRILAVASGPAMELQLYLRECTDMDRKRIEFVCIDQDEESLKHAQREILSIEQAINTGNQFRFINLAIKNILARGLPEGGFDLIYSAGLFDYFTDSVAQMAARRLHDGLRADGTLIIGNFSDQNPTRPLMEMVLDWHLLYRSGADLQRLFGKIGSALVVEQEALGINLFAIIQR
jgi:extracellular factor (EF) 3-hydroxypalmitic acid methyl ester biosynthesis protein